MESRIVSSSEMKEDASLSKDQCWALVQRITASPHFAKATQPRDILLYITHRCLFEDGTSISEVDIARNVLQRRSDFAPNDDSIVRVQMSHIRKKLGVYFSSEGKNEDILLTVPKGTYVPLFEQVAHEAPKTDIEATGGHDIGGIKKMPSAPTWAFGVTGVIVGALIVFLLSMFLRRSNAHPSATATTNPYAQNPLLMQIFGSTTPVSIVLADSSLSMVQDTLKTDVNVHDYSNSDYVTNLISKSNESKLQPALQKVYDRQYTSLGSTMVAIRCVELSQHFHGNISVRYARNMHVRDFENGNFVLIGSRRSVPWVELFESQLNFRYEENLQTESFYFRNMSPEHGEQPDYYQTAGKESYADVALVPNLGRTGYVLLLRGLAMESPEAAMGFLFDKNIARSLFDLEKSGRSFEVLLRNQIAEGASSGVDIVAVRYLQ